METLTGSSFGAQIESAAVLRSGRLTSGDRHTAVASLGRRRARTEGGTAEDALARLRDATAHGPALWARST
ncbi:hypothetical protein [Nocardia puris]|uniref:hypothetical protein n=1 Tax=Nocardia puris TaxID=208602 RepID=UPI0018DE949E|nr:hypothetical protein [Nocardia puris]